MNVKDRLRMMHLQRQVEMLERRLSDANDAKLLLLLDVLDLKEENTALKAKLTKLRPADDLAAQWRNEGFETWREKRNGGL